MTKLIRKNRSNPALTHLAFLAMLIRQALPTMAGPEFGSADYEAAFAAALDAVSVAKDRTLGRVYDVLVKTVGLELSAGNYWVDRVRLARLLLEPGDVPVVYGFVERVSDADEGTRIHRVWLVRPQRLRSYLSMTRGKAAFYLKENRLAPSTLNSQQHLRRCDIAYLAEWVVEFDGNGRPVARHVEPGERPAKRRRAA